ncbi:GNAT family N-acetyltransferase [Paracoccus xiamenensis]|uniref:GNAT family N-acetyltransferase n=1 Tax=Paracoccus xiamenensis TaxID=2714901 RepID=UPI001408C1B2|nr:N-acetyltransferase [Paracoccus xiamenensis]NHF73647.1 N-acetyltransferase [Paracoccus xiamenensis]
MPAPLIRPETPADAAAISALTTAAFAGAEHSDGTEAQIVARLRDAGALLLSLVAERDGEIIGHVAFSDVTIDGKDRGWVGLGPVSVSPGLQAGGIGSALIRDGISRLKSSRKGCVVLGDPGYYTRFGFAVAPGLTYPDVQAEYFMALSWDGPAPMGEVAYHPAFTG